MTKKNTAKTGQLLQELAEVNANIKKQKALRDELIREVRAKIPKQNNSK
ncbi:hypothetical protein [Eisenibacter elegans]|jgi:hypothetical protein|nr:hypothetical protein [Eisenibacter elegans]